ncbi:MAG: hypothetical protein HZB39_16395 [Planctomycetes bacterium]|nr:hypothetical protein [Planctomycetota bacterium]
MLLRSSKAHGSATVRVLALLAATLGCAAFAALRETGDATLLAVERALDGGALPSVTIEREGGLWRDDVARARALPGVRVVLPRARETVEIAGRDDRRASLALLGADLAQEHLARPARARDLRFDGALPEDFEIALPRVTARALGVGLGDTVTVRGTALRVAAVFDDDALPAAATLRTLATIRGHERVDSVEALLDSGRDPDAALVAFAEALGPPWRVAVPASRVATRPALRALRTTIEFGAWLALALGLTAGAAAARDRVLAKSDDLALQRALGAPPHVIAAQWLLPAAFDGACAGALGALAGSLLAPAFIAPLAALATSQLGFGVVLDVPPASPLDVLALAGLTSLAATLVAACGARARASPIARSRAVMIGVACLATAAAIALSGATRLHVVFRLADVACAAGGIVLLAAPLATARLLALSASFVVALSLLRASLADALPAHSAALIALAGLDRFAAAIAVLGFAASLAFALADVHARRDEHALLRALGAGPGERAAMTFRTGTAALLPASATAIAAGLLLGEVWRAGPLCDALGVASAFTWPHPAALAAPPLFALFIALAAAVAARARLTAW